MELSNQSTRDQFRKLVNLRFNCFDKTNYFKLINKRQIELHKRQIREMHEKQKSVIVSKTGYTFAII